MKQHVDVALLSEIHSRLQETTHHEGTTRHPGDSDSPELEIAETERSPHGSNHPDELSSIETIHVQPTNPLSESSAVDELHTPSQGLRQTLQRTSDYLRMTLRHQPMSPDSSIYTPLMWLKGERRKWKGRLENMIHAPRINANRFEIRESVDSSSTFNPSEQPKATDRKLRTEKQSESIWPYQRVLIHSELPATMDFKHETRDKRQEQSMLTGASQEDAKTSHAAVEGETGRDARQGRDILKDDACLEEIKLGCSLNIQKITQDNQIRKRTKSADQGSDLQSDDPESEDGATAPDSDSKYVNVEYRGIRRRRRRGKHGKSSKYVNVSLLD